MKTIKNVLNILKTGLLLLKGDTANTAHFPISKYPFAIRLIIIQGLYWRWIFNIFIGKKQSITSDKKVTVILQSYKRCETINELACSILKCSFVEKLIISNNNPEIIMEDWINRSDPRMILINNSERRGAGYRWILAEKENAEYFIAIDDDLFISPKQIKALFLNLIQDPDIPHGLFGSIFPKRISDLNEDDVNKYRQYLSSVNSEVDAIHRIYAVTKAHADTFIDYIKQMQSDAFGEKALGIEDVENVADDMVISCTSKYKPRIHYMGYILSSPNCATKGVALFSTEKDFTKRRLMILKVAAAIKYKKTGNEQ